MTMTRPRAWRSSRWRWLALLLAITLLTLTWGNAVAPRDERRATREVALTHPADCVDCQAARPARRDGARVHALAQCGACHAPDARSDASAPMLARWSLERPRPTPRAAVPAAADDATQVRAGGEIYRRACTHCHQRDRHAASGAAPRAVSIDDGAARERSGTRPLDAPLSDERMAALAAFLRRHADTLPWPDGARTVQDARL